MISVLSWCTSDLIMSIESLTGSRVDKRDKPRLFTLEASL